ncbi:MAG: hypothetical protein SFU56_11620 [Capsulimonadales bacterium]|nr:hypothetical protein [Capsulimonadales bacterium]
MIPASARIAGPNPLNRGHVRGTSAGTVAYLQVNAQWCGSAALAPGDREAPFGVALL